MGKKGRRLLPVASPAPFSAAAPERSRRRARESFRPPLAESERRDVLEIAKDRYGTRSTILTSQISVSSWHEQIADPTVADRILERLVHNAYRIELEGPSMRQVQALRKGKEAKDE